MIFAQRHAPDVDWFGQAVAVLRVVNEAPFVLHGVAANRLAEHVAGIAREEPVSGTNLFVDLEYIALAVREIMRQIAVIGVGTGSAIEPCSIGKLIRVLGQEFNRNRVKASLWNLVPGKRCRSPPGRTGTARCQRAGYALGVVDGISQSAERKVPVQHGLVRGCRGGDIGLVIVIQPIREEEEGLVLAVVKFGNDDWAAQNGIEIVIFEGGVLN